MLTPESVRHGHHMTLAKVAYFLLAHKFWGSSITLFLSQ